jgi:hypothetical protein
MNKGEFKKYLDDIGKSYTEEYGKIIVGGDEDYEEGDIDLSGLKSIPEGVTFRNEGRVDLESLIHLPKEIFFNNKGDVRLNSLTSLSNGINFDNGGNVFLNSLTHIPKGTIFSKVKFVNLESIIGKRPKKPSYEWAHDFFDSWEGNIEKIGYLRLLNKMISIGLFERK